MNKKNHDSSLYFFAAVCFFIAAFAGDMMGFYPIALCMFVLGVKQKGEKK